MSFKKELITVLPLMGEDFSIKYISEADTMKMSMAMEKEPVSDWTCRPLNPSAKSFGELNEKYSRLIENDSAAAYGIYCGWEFMGQIQVFDYNPRNKSAEIGYYLLPEYRGKGTMEKALTLFVRAVFENTGLNKLTAQTAEFNDCSVKLLKKLGFSLDGTLREHHEKDGKLYSDLIFSILKNEVKVK